MNLHTAKSGETDTRTTQQACSLLLSYPDDALIEQLPLLQQAVSDLPALTQTPLQSFLDYAGSTLREVQREHYVATFDMRRRCCPYLTYWTHGDTRNRGMAILRFKQTYRDCGVVPSEDELPDHLAVVLEFAALADPEAGNLLLGEHRVAIELLRDALHAVDSPYGHVLDAVVATLIPMTDELAERAKALAVAGPPTELVGVAGPIDISIAPYGGTSANDLTGARR